MIHGGATFGSSANRQQLPDCTNLLQHLVPTLITIMMNSKQAMWGEPIHLSHPLSEPAVLIHLASATQVPPKLEKLYDQLNAQFSIDGLTTFREYLNEVSNFSEIQGVVISARATAYSLELVLETDLTQQDFMQQWLVLALLFVLIGLAAIHFTRMVWLIVPPPPKKIR